MSAYPTRPGYTMGIRDDYRECNCDQRTGDECPIHGDYPCDQSVKREEAHSSVWQWMTENVCHDEDLLARIVDHGWEADGYYDDERVCIIPSPIHGKPVLCLGDYYVYEDLGEYIVRQMSDDLPVTQGPLEWCVSYAIGIGGEG